MLLSTTTLQASIFEVVELNRLGETGEVALVEYCRGITFVHETEASSSSGSNKEGGLLTCLPLALQSEMERELVAAASQGSAESPEVRGRNPCWLGIW